MSHRMDPKKGFFDIANIRRFIKKAHNSTVSYGSGLNNLLIPSALVVVSETLIS